jgi:hypothetical protein
MAANLKSPNVLFCQDRNYKADQIDQIGHWQSDADRSRAQSDDLWLGAIQLPLLCGLDHINNF